MSLNATEIGLVVDHLADLCTGGRVQKVFGRDADTIVLRLRAVGGNVFVLLCAHPRLSRVHSLPDRGECPHTSPFVSALRGRLSGARVVGMEAEPGDRRMRMCFETGDGPYAVEAELFGIGSNLVLVGPEGKVVEALRHVRGQKRSVLPGRPYDPPPNVQPQTRPSRFGDTPAEADRAVRDHYEPRHAQERVEALRRQVQSRLRAEHKRAAGKARSLAAAVDRLDEADKIKQQGELLKASMHLIQPRAESVRVPDYFDPATPEVEIKLQPDLSPAANVERYFKRYHKIKTAAQLGHQQLPAAEGAVQRLDEARRRLEAAQSADEVQQIALECFGKAIGDGPERKPRAAPAGPRQFTSRDGLLILAGRTEAENDRVTFRMARGNDLWFHVQGIPGGHVIVRVERGRSVPLEALLDAAALAKLYSTARDADAVDVDYTHRKYVRKRKGGGAGDVDYSQSKTLHVRQDDERLRRLFAASGNPG